MNKLDILSKLNDYNSQHKRKRGRPKKNESMNISTIENKKKGRKSKDNDNLQTISKKQLSIDEHDEDEIIVHLAINKKDIDNNNDDSDEFNSSESDTDIKKTERSSTNNIFTINDMSDNISSSDDSNTELKKKIKEQENLIKDLKQEILRLKDSIDTDTQDTYGKRVTKMNINFIDIKDNKSIVLEKTNIACWWCTYNFDTMPCFIPEKYENNKFYVYGCFCSYNCAAAYNINMQDYKVWERYFLMKKLNNMIYNTNDEIKIAPPRETLIKFGGVLTIEKYRENNRTCIKDYRFLIPPMMPIIPMIEEILQDKTFIKSNKNDKLDNNLSLKRSKPLPHTKNNLLDTIGFVKKK